VARSARVFLSERRLGAMTTIDLTLDEDDDDEEQANNNGDGGGDVECEICYHLFRGGVWYRCCARFCCLTCFRENHVARERVPCPYCRRETAEVWMDLITLRYRCLATRVSGTVCVSPADRLSRLPALIALSPAWSTERSGSAASCASMMVGDARGREIALTELPLFTSTLRDGDLLLVRPDLRGHVIYV